MSSELRQGLPAARRGRGSVREGFAIQPGEAAGKASEQERLMQEVAVYRRMVRHDIALDGSRPDRDLRRAGEGTPQEHRGLENGRPTGCRIHSGLGRRGDHRATRIERGQMCRRAAGTAAILGARHHRHERSSATTVAAEAVGQQGKSRSSQKDQTDESQPRHALGASATDSDLMSGRIHDASVLAAALRSSGVTDSTNTPPACSRHCPRSTP